MPCAMPRSDERTCEFLRASGSRGIVKASRGAFIIKDATSSEDETYICGLGEFFRAQNENCVLGKRLQMDYN
jgi:hypothetical protein